LLALAVGRKGSRDAAQNSFIAKSFCGLEGQSTVRWLKVGGFTIHSKQISKDSGENFGHDRSSQQ